MDGLPRRKLARAGGVAGLAGIAILLASCAGPASSEPPAPRASVALSAGILPPPTSEAPAATGGNHGQGGRPSTTTTSVAHPRRTTTTTTVATTGTTAPSHPPPTTTTFPPSAQLGSFVLTASPNASGHHDELHGAAGVRGGSAGVTFWAVGDYFDGTSDRTLVERASASGWTIVPSPDASGKHDELDGVSGSSSDDVWAVGRYTPAAGQDRSLAEHWDGTRWKVVPVASEGLYHNELDAVTDVAPDNVWAVGHYDRFPKISDEALVEHWDGRAWTVVASPHVSGQHSGLVGVAAVPGTSTVWAVGYRILDKVTRTLVERRSGGTWSIIPSPDVGLAHNELDGVTAVSADEVWAVGWYFDGSADRTLIEEWNGRSWRVVPSPDANDGHNSLQAVAASGADQVFAVGQYFGGVNDETLIEEWDGEAWHVIPSADSPQHLHNQLDGVAAAANVGAVAVGTYFDGSADRTLIERYPFR